MTRSSLAVGGMTGSLPLHAARDGVAVMVIYGEIPSKVTSAGRWLAHQQEPRTKGLPTEADPQVMG
jgi:hypothetical protein